MTTDRDEEGKRLESYIDRSRRVQSRLKAIVATGAVASAGTALVHGLIALSLLLTTAFIGVIGFYITGMHIAEWRQKLYELRHPLDRDR